MQLDLDEDRGISYGEMSYIQSLSDVELYALYNEVSAALETRDTILLEDYEMEILTECERRGLEHPANRKEAC